VRGRFSKAWLSLTPEPERELPAALAVLRARGPASPELLDAERTRAERVVLHGSEAAYLSWLAEAAGLAAAAQASADAGQARADDDVARAAAVVRDVVGNQAGLLLGLPGGGDRRDGVRRVLQQAPRIATPNGDRSP
jgi:hypothetical protein